MSALQNRPFKFGPKDRVEFIVYNSEMKIITELDANGNPIYIGRAKIGSDTSDDVWQISFIRYGTNGSFEENYWPVNSIGAPSSEYEFNWDNRVNFTYL